jgi:type IV pilus assembly protein PilA
MLDGWSIHALWRKSGPLPIMAGRPPSAIGTKGPQMPKHISPTARLLRQEDGFTFIELLVVIIIIGILVAIALPQFLKEKNKATDADAKSAASLLVTHVETCNTEPEDFTKCDDPTEINLNGLPWGTNPGEVSVIAADEKTYTVRAVSEVSTSGTQHTFTIKRDLSGSPPSITRDCTVAGKGGCPPGGTW